MAFAATHPSSPGPLGRWLGVAARVALVALVVAFLGVLVHRLDWPRLGHVLARARIAPLLLATALCFACLWAKAISWRVILAPRHRVATARLFRYAIAAYAASALAPVRAGEALRLWALKQRDGVPVADSAATAVCEKILDGAAMFALALPAAWLVPDLPRALRLTMQLGPLAVAIAIGALAVAGARAERRGSDAWLARFMAGMHVLRSPRRALAAFGALLAAWAIDLAMVELVLYAVGTPLPPATAFIVLLAINLAIAVPTTPAQVGVHEAGAIAGLSLFHVPAEPAVAFALLYHALQIILLVAVGLALEWRLVIHAPGHVPAHAPR